MDFFIVPRQISINKNLKYIYKKEILGVKKYLENCIKENVASKKNKCICYTFELWGVNNQF